MKIFFDTSAFVKRYVEELGSEQVISLCEQASALSLSIVSVTEFVSATARLQREKKITAQQYKQLKDAFFSEITDIRLCAITLGVIHRSIQLVEEYGLKTLDALQIGCALEWGAEQFASADRLQAKAAQCTGMHVIVV